MNGRTRTATLMEDAPSGDAIIKSNGFDFLLLPKMSYLCCNVAHLRRELITISTSDVDVLINTRDFYFPFVTF